MQTERTFAIIKPDAVKARHAGKILARIEEAGFTIRGMRFIHLTRKEAEGFYAVHKARPFFASLTEFMSSGPCIVMALEAPDAIKKWRTLMGATDPGKADAGTLRKAVKGVPNIDIIINGHTPANTTPADMAQYADYVADFVAHVQAAKKAGKTAAQAVAEWKNPEKYTGYGAPNAQRATAYAQIIMDETK